MIPVFLTSIFGNIESPWGEDRLDVGDYAGSEGQGLIVLLNNILKTAVAVAGVFSIIQILTAGYAFMSAQGDAEKVAAAWRKIWQSLLGLVIIAGTLILAAVFGYLIFGQWDAIISPRIYGPTATSTP